MRAEVKTATKNSLIYSLGNASFKLAGLILLPIYAKHLSIQDYGVINVIDITLQVLASVFIVGLNYALDRWYFDKEYITQRGAIIFTVLFFLVLLQCGVITMGISLSATISLFLFGNVSYSAVLRLALICASMEVIFQVFQTFLKLEEKAIYYSVCNVLKLIVALMGTIYGIVYANMGFKAIYIAQLLSYAVYFICLIPLLLKTLQFTFAFSILKDMLFFGYPFVLTSIFNISTSFADIYLLTIYTDFRIVGIYSLANKVANLVKVIVISSLQLSINPLIFKMFGQANPQRFYANLMNGQTAVIAICLMVVSLFGQEGIMILAAGNLSYIEAYKLIPFLCLVIFIVQIKDTAGIGASLMKKSKQVAIIVFMVASLNIFFDWLFIPLFLSYGVILSSLVAQSVFFALILWLSQKVYPIPYQLSKIGWLLLLAIAIGWTGLAISSMSLFVRVLLKLILLGIFSGFLIKNRYIRESELQPFITAIKNRLPTKSKTT